MARGRLIPLMRRAIGLCNTRDPVRLGYDRETGSTQMAQAVNIDIDDSGRPSRCVGYTQKRAEASHSAFTYGETDCLFVAGTVLYRLNPDYSRTAIRTGLTSGARMSYARVGDRVYYMNGHEAGYVVGVANYSWTAGTSGAPTSNVTYSNPPLGHLIAFAFGRMLVAKGAFIFASEPSFYGRFNLARYHGEGERVTMLRGIEGGLAVGTEKRVVFYHGNHWYQVERKIKADYGVLEGSDTWAPGGALRRDWSDRGIVFSTPKGVCTFAPGGVFRNETEDNIKLPAARAASAAVIEHRYIAHINP